VISAERLAITDAAETACDLAIENYRGDEPADHFHVHETDINLERKIVQYVIGLHHGSGVLKILGDIELSFGEIFAYAESVSRT
jgi:hypothetical protein